MTAASHCRDSLIRCQRSCHARSRASVYRNSLIHSWHLFAASMTPDETLPSRQGGGLQLGLLGLLRALRIAVDDFLEHLATDPEIQSNALARYRRLRDTATA